LVGFFLGVVGVIYGVLLAFMTVVVWEKYNTATENVSREATAARMMHRNLDLYPEQEEAERIKQQLRAYLHTVVTDEFPAMIKMKKSPATDQSMNNLWHDAEQLNPKNLHEQALFIDILDDLNAIAQYRDERLGTAYNPKLIGIIRFIIILGALITLFFAIIFAAENFWWHITMTAMLALLLCTILYILMELAHPFMSGISIKPDGYIDLLEMIKGK